MFKKISPRIFNSWNTDRIVGFSAMAISLMTLVTFVYQTQLMERQSRLSVLPYLSIATSYNPSLPSFSIRLENLGVGPAVLVSRSIIYKGKTYNMDIDEFFLQEIPAFKDIAFLSYTSLDTGDVLPAGTSEVVLGANDSLSTVNLLMEMVFELQEEGLDYEIVYKSIYEEEWKITSSTNAPIKLK